MKILISPGFGAGWSSWSSDDQDATIFMLTYQPLIDTLEAGGDIGYDKTAGGVECFRPGSVLEGFHLAYKEKFGETPYLGGARNLEVAEVDGPFRIHEYDGSEHVEYRDDIDWIDPDTSFINAAEEDFGD